MGTTTLFPSYERGNKNPRKMNLFPRYSRTDKDLLKARLKTPSIPPLPKIPLFRIIKECPIFPSYEEKELLQNKETRLPYEGKIFLPKETLPVTRPLQKRRENTRLP